LNVKFLTTGGTIDKVYIAAAHPEIVTEMSAKLDEIMKGGKKNKTTETK
jgi:hypothetical protein